MVFNAVIKVCLLLTFIIRRVITKVSWRQFQQTIAMDKESATTSFKLGSNSQNSNHLLAKYRKIMYTMNIERKRKMKLIAGEFPIMHEFSD